MLKLEAAVTEDMILSVSDLSLLLKGVVETAFAVVKIRGEISGVKRASSGHIYFTLKDEGAVIDAVAWRGQNNRFAASIKDGLEVVVRGKITTYPMRSNYQIVVEDLEAAGEGALLKLLEEMKKKLAAEGLFDAARKKPIPYMPRVIGVVTSPTGAVIRDIIHRVRDRFPSHILLWSVPVQGVDAAAAIAAAVRGFNDGESLRARGLPVPDVLIVARGGGSIEDLWAFNEEIVVRAVADSAIPVISAVGHETDTTLIDYAADLRAPTPTGAAEMATPVRLELVGKVQNYQGRLADAAARTLTEKSVQLLSAVRGIPNLRDMVEMYVQRLDDKTERLKAAMKNYVDAWQNRFNYVGKSLELCSYRKVLERGFSLVVSGASGELVSSADMARKCDEVNIRFKDGEVGAKIARQISSLDIGAAKKNNSKSNGAKSGLKKDKKSSLETAWQGEFEL